MRYVGFEGVFEHFIGKPIERYASVLQTLRAIHAQPHQNILDLVGGRGETLLLMNSLGFRVDMNEVEKANRMVARKRLADFDVHIFGDDWRDMLQVREHAKQFGPYEAAFTDGNSFPTYLKHGADREQAMREFNAVIKLGGRLAVDFRNYAAWPVDVPIPLKKEWHYFGPMQGAGLRHGDGRITLGYQHEDMWSKLELYDTNISEVMGLFLNAGFLIDAIYLNQDWSKGKRKDNPNAFFQMVGKKTIDM